MNIDFTRLTRLTIVDETGRILEKWQADIEPSVQDGGRTLKLFVNHNPSKPRADRNWLPKQDPRDNKPLAHKDGK